MIPPHGIGVHLTAGIGDQLRTDRGQFAQIRSNGIEHGTDGVIIDLGLQRPEFAADERDTFARTGLRGTLVDLGAQVTQLTGQCLGPPAAGVRHHQHGARREVGSGRRDQRDGVLAGFIRILEHHHPFIGEQRRTEQFGEFTG